MKREIYEEISSKLCKSGKNIIVGSFPLYYLFQHKKVSQVDDLDVVVFSDTIDYLTELFHIIRAERKKLKDERFVYGRKQNIQVREYPGDVYNIGLIYNNHEIDMCVFPNGKVNIIEICGDPFEISFEKGKILIPPLGIFYISRLHPYAITQKRVENTSLIINNRGESPSELAYVSRDALKKAVVEYKIELEQIIKARNIGTNRRDDKFKEYMYLTYDINFLTSRVY
ncbi:MAG: hypothetical protein QXF88_02910 [Candidatus Aenigmatarchaeota archaeon]